MNPLPRWGVSILALASEALNDRDHDSGEQNDEDDRGQLHRLSERVRRVRTRVIEGVVTRRWERVLHLSIHEDHQDNGNPDDTHLNNCPRLCFFRLHSPPIGHFKRRVCRREKAAEYAQKQGVTGANLIRCGPELLEWLECHDFRY